MPFEVACVGSPKNRPPAPVFADSISAQASAASVFPSPIGASIIYIPPGAAPDTSEIISLCVAFGGKPKRSSNIPSVMPKNTSECHGEGNDSLSHAASTLAG